jgi:signal transduction histidine kinase
MHWPALGLRPRLVAALALVGAVALGVMAIAVLQPLERRLRDDQSSSLAVAARSVQLTFRQLVADPKQATQRELTRRLESLARSTQATVVSLTDSQRIVASSDTDEPGRPSDARPALVRDVVMRTTREGQIFVAVPFTVTDPVTHRPVRYALTLRKRLNDVASASRVVQSAFLAAGLAAFAVALVLGLALSAALLRRLGRLRDSARGMTEHGLRAEPPVDTSRDEIGELSRAFAAMQDGLRRQENARRTFVATASHELRTPLASLQGTLELLEEDLGDESPDIDDARAQVASAHQQAKRLTALSVDLLDLTRLDADVPLRSEPVELGEVAQAVAAEFAVRGHDSGVALALDRPGPLWCSGDPGAIARVLRILIDNAMRYAPRDSAVAIDVFSDNGQVGAAVSDRGPGVPSDEHQIVFERFRRGRSPAGGGFGLGLAIGRELAQRMDGTLELVGDGSGARFELRLPGAPDGG